MITVPLSTLAVGIVTAVVVYLKRRHPIDKYDIETFLKSYGSPGPKRYSYAELKKITNSFSDKLGEVMAPSTEGNCTMAIWLQ